MVFGLAEMERAAAAATGPRSPAVCKKTARINTASSMSSVEPQRRVLPVGLVAFLTAGSAACVAEVASIPFDTSKVRMQLQSLSVPSVVATSPTSTATAATGVAALPSAAVPYKGTIDALRRIAAEEGFLALYRGLFPGLQRQMLFAGTRISLYEPVRDFYHEGGGNPPLIKKILAGLTTGAIGITIASPTCVARILVFQTA